MKNFTFLLTGLFLLGNTTITSARPNLKPSFTSENSNFRVDYNEEEPIQFIERGIEFFVFPNGEFDFNTRPEDGNNGDYYFKTAGKRASTINERHCPENYGVRIERDAFGRVRRVGNTFINYDAFDRVKRIGTVYMRYNNFALTQIGGLHIVYDRRGRIVDMFGTVKGYRNGYVRPYDMPRNGNGFDDYYYRTTPENIKSESENDAFYYRKNDVNSAVEKSIEKK